MFMFEKSVRVIIGVISDMYASWINAIAVEQDETAAMRRVIDNATGK